MRGPPSAARGRQAPAPVAVRRKPIDRLRGTLADDGRRARNRDTESPGRGPGRSVLRAPHDDPEHRVIERAGRGGVFAQRGAVSERSSSRRRESSGWPALSGRLPEPRSESVHSIGFGAGDLAAVRGFIAAHADEAGLTTRGREDLVLAVSELATNSILHGGGGGVCRVWSEDANLLCEVSDAGRIRSPLAGRVRPSPDQVGGRGLWVVHQICELVQVRSGEHGTVVRILTRVRP